MDENDLRPYTAGMQSTVLRTFASILLLSAATLACGAKTGLRVPDVPDAPPDALAVPDALPPFCIEPVPTGSTYRVSLETRAQLTVADIFFVIDRTGSMDGEIDNIKRNLQNTIVPQIRAAINDVQFGVATYSDFPITPYGDRMDIPFTLVTPIDRSLANIQGALNSVMAGGGGDNPEAMVEALYQVATGEGYLPWIPPRAPCASPGRLGYACFRREAQPILVLIADAPSHNGPSTGLRDTAYNDALFLNPPACPATLPMCRASRGPHTYAEARAALQRLNARVIGVSSGSPGLSGLTDMQIIARDTGTVTAAGVPLVISINTDGSDLDTRVVSAVQTFTRQVRFNASARVVDLDPQRPATRIVAAVRPQSADPMGNVQRTDDTTFYGVVPGTRLTFSLELVSPLPRTDVEQRFPTRVQFLGDGRANLGWRDLEIVIPPIDRSCDGDASLGDDARTDASVE
jgi:hypothetical protein